MSATIGEYLQAPALTPYERQQREQTLSSVLWTIMGAAVLIGFVNFYLDAIPETIALFTTAVLCLPVMILNNRGYYQLAGNLTSILILVSIDYNLYEGHGIHDPGIVSMPIFVIFGGLLFSRRSLPLFALAAIASVLGVAVLDMTGVIHTRLGASWADIAVISLLILTSAVLASVIIGNLEKNLERAKHSEAALRQGYDLTLEGWAKALEFRDQETEGHTRRVVDLCMRLAKEWEFTEEEMTDIYRGALLHDIGKMAIPDQILFKPGRLNQREWQLMRRHTLFARDMLANIPFLQSALNIPLSHHEHWDGTGYPQGLRGQAIPLEARIFAVVDQFDALSSNRPYRKAWPKKQILAYIETNSGKMFDPLIAATFMRLYERGAFEERAVQSS